MIQIRHRQTSKLLLGVDAETLRGVDLSQQKLMGADLAHQDLAGANLQKATLDGADLFGANLTDAALDQASLVSTELTDAVLHSASLHSSNLRGACLHRAQLTGAILNSADLSHSDLSGSRLERAFLMGTNFSGANLCAADFYFTTCVGVDFTNASMNGAEFGFTAISFCPTLASARGLGETIHLNYSSIDLPTLRALVPVAPVVFLRELGFSDGEIEALRRLYTAPGQFSSCFLSHASVDDEFVARLREGLMSNGVSCWHYSHDMRGGDLWRPQITDAIKRHEKLIVVCSTVSVQRTNVVDEIIEAIRNERESNTRKLFPVRIDDYILSREALMMGDAKVAAREWPENWIRYVQQFQIPDFRRWRQGAAYKLGLDKLLRDLEAPEAR